MLQQIRETVDSLLAGAERDAVDLDRFLWLDLSRGRLDGYCCLFFAPDGSGPTLVAKAARADERKRTYREDDANLRALEAAGFNSTRRAAPRPLGLREERGVLVTLQSALPGRLMRNLPARRLFAPRRTGEVTDRVCSWLTGLERAFGVERREIDDALYESEVLAVVRRFLGRYLVSADEAEFLQRRFDERRGLLGRSLPFTVAHGDFCPANLVLDDAGIAAFDWEHPLEHRLPLYDLLFFFSATRFPFGGLRRESSYARSMVAVYWGDGYLSRALRRRIAETCERLAIPHDAVEDLFLLALLLRADRKYDLYRAASGLGDDAAQVTDDDDEKRRRWSAMRALERDAPLHWVHDGALLGLRHVVRHGLPRLTT